MLFDLEESLIGRGSIHAAIAEKEIKELVEKGGGKLVAGVGRRRRYL